MSRDEEERARKTGASPQRAVRIFCALFDEVVGHLSFAAVAFHSETASKFGGDLVVVLRVVNFSIADST